LVVIYGKQLGSFVAADCWLAAENMMLAACGMGLGSCVIGFAVAALNTPEWKTELEIPQDYTAYAPILLGYPVEKNTPPALRKAPDVLAWRKGIITA
jgi:nitroreductase